jgi:hypothetical protein
MSGPLNPFPQIDWKARSLDWMFQQGVSTILLLLLVFGLYQGIPWARACMKEDIMEIHSANAKSIDKLIENGDVHLDKTIQAFQEDQARDQRLLEDLLPGVRRGSANLDP